MRELIEALRQDAGGYRRHVEGPPSSEILSWDQREVRAWKAAEALEAVLALHEPYFSRVEPMGDYCQECGELAPCATVRAVESALAEEGDRA